MRAVPLAAWPLTERLTIAALAQAHPSPPQQPRTLSEAPGSRDGLATGCLVDCLSSTHHSG